MYFIEVFETLFDYSYQRKFPGRESSFSSVGTGLFRRGAVFSSARKLLLSRALKKKEREHGGASVRLKCRCAADCMTMEHRRGGGKAPFHSRRLGRIQARPEAMERNHPRCRTGRGSRLQSRTADFTPHNGQSRTARRPSRIRCRSTTDCGAAEYVGFESALNRILNLPFVHLFLRGNEKQMLDC